MRRRREEARGAAGRAAPAARADGAGGPRGTAPDFTTTQRLDLPIAPAVTASDAFFEFLFSKAPVHYDELKRQGERSGAAPVVSPRRRHADLQRRRRLRGRPDAADAERRRHRRGHRPAAQVHLRRVRRALRSRRLRRRGTDVRRHASVAARPRDAGRPPTIASGTAPTTTDRGRWR